MKNLFKVALFCFIALLTSCGSSGNSQHSSSTSSGTRTLHTNK